MVSGRRAGQAAAMDKNVDMDKSKSVDMEVGKNMAMDKNVDMETRQSRNSLKRKNVGSATGKRKRKSKRVDVAMDKSRDRRCARSTSRRRAGWQGGVPHQAQEPGAGSGGGENGVRQR